MITLNDQIANNVQLLTWNEIYLLLQSGSLRSSHFCCTIDIIRGSVLNVVKERA